MTLPLPLPPLLETSVSARRALPDSPRSPGRARQLVREAMDEPAAVGLLDRRPVGSGLGYLEEFGGREDLGDRQGLGDRGELGDLEDTVEMLTSELVTNAVLHARSMGIVQIRVSLGTVRVSVDDTSPVLPRPRAESLAEGGRGLLLVEGLSTSWGWALTETGKQVWFQMELPVAAVPLPEARTS